MTPEQIFNRRQDDLKRFTGKLRNREPFAVVKFNDGEWHAMTGRAGTNCDNHEYSEPLRRIMRKAYSFLRNRASLSDYIVNHCAYLEHSHYAVEAGYPSDWFVNFAFLHDLPYKNQYDCRTPELRDFYQAIRDDPRPKIFIGPKRIDCGKFLKIQDRIHVPLINAFDKIEEISEQALNLARNITPIFLISAGFCSCILSYRILETNPNATIIDLGSALDPLLFGKTRKSQLPTGELRDFYSGFVDEWPEIPHYYDEIPGWFNFLDLYKSMVDRFPSGSHFVEVGTWLGKSAAAMGVEIVRSGKQITFDCVDTFRGSPGEKVHEIAKTRNIKGMCANNLRPFWSTRANQDYETRVDNILRIVPTSSTNAALGYPDKSIDFVFIDAGHTEKDVRKDIAAWRPKVKPGGVLAGHDYSDSFPGVRAAVDSMVPERQLVSKNCWMVEC